MSRPATLPPREDGFARKKWSVRECRFLADSGLLEPGKYELIEGEVVFKMGQGRLHIDVVGLLFEVLLAIFGKGRVQTQAPIGVGAVDEFNDPEPDAAVLRGKRSDYKQSGLNPATDVLLVAEASDSSLPGDLTVKANLYAQHGIPEYWVVAIPRRELVVFRQPAPGGYGETQTYAEDAEVAPLSAPDSPVRVADLLP